MAGRVLMQGLNTATQELVTWSVESADWLGEQAPVPVADVALYTRSRVSVSTIVPIVCVINAPADGASFTEGQIVTITGTISRPGTVDVKKQGGGTLGAASVVGLNWSFLHTLTAGDVGSLTFTATATDAVNGTTSEAPGVAVTVAAAATFPAGITPLLRLDGVQPAYRDLGQTVLALGPSDRVRSIPQPSPLAGSWTAPNDAERPSRDYGGGIVFEPLALDYPTHRGQFLNAPSTSIPSNNVTFAISFRAFALYGGPLQTIMYGTNWGLILGGNGVTVAYNNIQWDTGIRLGKDINPSTLDTDNGTGNQIVIVVTLTATSVSVYVDEEGTVSTASLPSVTIPTSTAGMLEICGGQGNIVVGQVAVIASAISGSDRTSLVNFMKARGVPDAYPTTRPYIGIIGDSIANSLAATRPGSWAYRMLANLRSTYPTVRLLNAAIVGSGAIPTTGNNSIQYKTVARYFSALRARNILVTSVGSNECTNNYTDAGVDSRLAIVYATCDAARALGVKTAVATVLNRSGLLGATTQAQFNHAQARWNASLDANVGTHFDVLIDQRTVTAMLDPTDTTYYTDGVHPTPVGHALLEPVFTAPVASLLA